MRALWRDCEVRSEARSGRYGVLTVVRGRPRSGGWRAAQRSLERRNGGVWFSQCDRGGTYARMTFGDPSNGA